MKNKNQLLRALPKVDECLSHLGQYIEQNNVPVRLAKKAVQNKIQSVRQAVLNEETVEIPDTIEQWRETFIEDITEICRPNLRRVINATGVIVHTNLGRSLLSDSATKQLGTAGAHYTNLEFDLRNGKRGSRYSLVEEIICDLTGAEAALVVNNNAAAVLIALDTLARDKEVIVSRGQLVEIGGSFRIPDVMAKSGAQLVEVGATNRTHLYDYEGAITEQTALLLRVHTSNFRIIGFTSEVSAEEMVELGRKYELAVMEDLGSGCLIDMSGFGLPAEQTVQEVVKSGADVVTFSGDKLLGGPQAGIIVGNKKQIDKIKRNPLNRAVRIDKFTLASLESVLRSYYDIETALKHIPTLRMISEKPGVVKKRAQKFTRRIGKKLQSHCVLCVVPTASRVGGGALPEYNLDSWAVEIQPMNTDVSTFEQDFRKLEVPVIGRIEHDRFLLDFKTIQDHEIAELADILVTYFRTVS
jgi:L-seryl-tRNA(Ser) seleniumtransferase